MAGINRELLEQTQRDIRTAIEEFRNGAITRDALDSVINGHGKVIRASQVILGDMIYEMELDKRTNPKLVQPEQPKQIEAH